MSNVASKAYGLTILSPIRENIAQGVSGSVLTRAEIENLSLHQHSPFAKVANTYLARLYVLNDVMFQGYPEKEDHLKSKYLVFASNFYGDLDEYLTGLWRNAKTDVKKVWAHCYDFESVTDEASFLIYMKKCQIKTTFFFNGSVDLGEDDTSLNEQLKALYLKQEFAEFVWNNQNLSSNELKAAFIEFTHITQPNQPEPRWAPGHSDVAQG